MKGIKYVLLLVGCWCVVLGAAASAQEAPSVAGRELKKYFPGDFVHILVKAPLDTRAITSVMPNGDRIELVHDRRADIWQGIWQVPIGFQSGSYSAQLQAQDLEGNSFTGETAPFVIGELTMIAMIKTSPEAETHAERSQRLAVNAAKLTEKVKPVPVKKKTAAKAKPPVKTRQMKLVEANGTKELNVTQVKLVTIARYYMEKMDFDKVRTSLKTLTRNDPSNQEYKKMLRRVEAVIKNEKEKKK